MLKIILSALLFIPFVLTAQTFIPLYKDSIPNAIPHAVQESKKGNLFLNVTVPSVQLFQPSGSNQHKTAVIICPGGSYGSLSYTNEGLLIAEAFNKIGVSAFILKYRLPDVRIMREKTIGPLQDALQAIKIVKMRAAEWGINPELVGIIGFSAGGHLASTVATHFNAPVIENKEQISLRPAFEILVYPVISMKDSLTHRKSRTNLLGESPSLTVIDFFSNETQVTADTPPTMLFHAADDKVVSVLNSLRFYESLIKNNVMSEMHLYDVGKHGFGASVAVKRNWFSLAKNWLERNEWISKNN